MFVAGVDGCRNGWICFKVELPSLATSVENLDLGLILKDRPRDLCCVGIDIPIGLTNGVRECDSAARRLLWGLLVLAVSFPYRAGVLYQHAIMPNQAQ